MRPSSPSPKTQGETKQDWILPELYEGKACRKFNRSFPKQPWNNLDDLCIVWWDAWIPPATFQLVVSVWCIWQRCMAPSQQAPSQALVTLHHKPHGTQNSWGSGCSECKMRTTKLEWLNIIIIKTSGKKEKQLCATIKYQVMLYHLQPCLDFHNAATQSSGNFLQEWLSIIPAGPELEARHTPS